MERDTVAATTIRHPLVERLLSRGWEFPFFQAIWLLERYCSDRLPVGDRGPVAKEAFRFRPDVAMGFPASDVRRITERTEAAADTSYYQVDVTFMGLYGVSSPLPIHYAIDILRSVDKFSAAESQQNETTAGGERQTALSETGSSPARDFLDIFHHRLISLFYRSWLKYRYDVSFGIPGRNVITDYLLWLIGCPGGFDNATLGVSPIRMIRYAGILTQRPRSGVTLEGMLGDYWKDVAVEVEQCVGRWVPLSQADMNRAGVANSTMGVDLTVGEQVYDLSGAFNISMGPMNWTTYLSFLPDGTCFEQTRSLVQLFCADPLSFTIELSLNAGEVPEMQLSSGAEAARLGFTSWVRTDDIPETSVTFSSTSVASSSAPGGPMDESVEAETSYEAAIS